MSDPPLDEQLEALNEVLQSEDSIESSGGQQQMEKARKVLGLIERVRKSKESARNLDHAEFDTAGQQSGATKEIDVSSPANSTESPPTDVDQASEPRKIDRFLIKRQLGQGGYGLVFLAHDPQLDRDVALKIPRPEVVMTPSLRSRFLREAKAAASLSHPNIVPVYQSGGDGPICFIAYEFIEGITLAEWLAKSKDNGLPDPNDAARLLATLADAVHHAHQRGVLHRDLKPANVMLQDVSPGSVAAQQVVGSEEGQAGDSRNPTNSLQPMITDFGLAKIIASDEVPVEASGQTRTGALVGTPAYMSPEHVRSAKELIGPSTDIYSLGVLFYELLTHHNPFSRDSLIDTMAAVQNLDPVAPSRLNSRIPRDLDAVVLKCLEKNTTDRYTTAADFRADLERFLILEPVQARKITAVTRSAKWISRNRLVAALLVLLGVGFVGATIGLVRARQAEANAREAEKEWKFEAETAVRVSDFLEHIFEVPDLMRAKPGQQRGREITAEEILVSVLRTAS